MLSCCTDRTTYQTISICFRIKVRILLENYQTSLRLEKGEIRAPDGSCGSEATGLEFQRKAGRTLTDDKMTGKPPPRPSNVGCQEERDVTLHRTSLKLLSLWTLSV